jgi:hypothetical protein
MAAWLTRTRLPKVRKFGFRPAMMPPSAMRTTSGAQAANRRRDAVRRRRGEVSENVEAALNCRSRRTQFPTPIEAINHAASAPGKMEILPRASALKRVDKGQRVRCNYATRDDRRKGPERKACGAPPSGQSRGRDAAAKCAASYFLVVTSCIESVRSLGPRYRSSPFWVPI